MKNLELQTQNLDLRTEFLKPNFKTNKKTFIYKTVC